MYHYVRPDSQGLPWLKYLSLADFRQQLDYFQERYDLITYQRFNEIISLCNPPKNALVLTFDDGFSDHYQFVFPELRKRGLWGIFYVPTGPYHTQRLLQVHRIHALHGSLGGARAYELLQAYLKPEMLVYQHKEDFRRLTYIRQDNDSASTAFKRILNYFVSQEHQKTLLDLLMLELTGNEVDLTSRWYMSVDNLRTMKDAGMLIGSHSVSHPVLSKLNESQQRAEIEDSFRFLQGELVESSMTTFCYPYGGFHSFSVATERILSEVGCQFAFNVEMRDVSPYDIRMRPQALPRYDCNQFPFGKATYLSSAGNA
jgi:peptidoglycan/xylan/chitin deacetylase (PgdA/CDA1 family)